MTVDYGKYINYDGENSNVKHFLTFTFKSSGPSLQKKYYEILTYLHRHNLGYKKQIAAYFGRDRREYEYAFKKLVENDLIEKVGERSSCISYQLNNDVKNYFENILPGEENVNVKKTGEGVVNSSFSSSFAPSPSSFNVKDKSKTSQKAIENNPSDCYRLHRHSAYYRYTGNQPQLNNSRHKNQDRFRDHFRLGKEDWTVEFTKNFVIVHCPARLSSLNDYQKLRDLLLIDLTKIVIAIERRYPTINLSYDSLKHESNNKFEIAAYDPFNTWFAEPYINAGQTIHERDFTIDASKGQPEVDLINQYAGGEGVRKFQAMLDLSDNILPGINDTLQLMSGVSNTLNTLVQQNKETTEQNTKQEQYNLTVLQLLSKMMDQQKTIAETQKETAYALTDLKETLRNDIEVLQEQLTRNYLEQTNYGKVTEGLVVHSGHTQDLILQLLQKGESTVEQIAAELQEKYSTITYHFKQLEKKGLVGWRAEEGHTRGRPRKIYRIKVNKMETGCKYIEQLILADINKTIKIDEEG